MQKIVLLALSSLTALGFTACPVNPTNPGTGTDTLILTGQIANYTGGAKSMAGVTLLDLSTSVGQGQLQANGAFSMTLSANSSLNLQSIATSCPGANVTPSDAKMLFLTALVTYVPNNKAEGSVYFATGTDSTVASYKRQTYFIADKNVTINAVCDGSSFNLNLQKGWNKVTTSYTYNQGTLTGTNFSSDPMPANAAWFYSLTIQ